MAAPDLSYRERQVGLSNQNLSMADTLAAVALAAHQSHRKKLP